MHSKFPWVNHPHTPTAVFDGDGRLIIDQWVAPDRWLPIETAPKSRILLLFAVTDIREDGSVNNWKMATGSYHEGYERHDKLSPWAWDGRQLYKYEIHPTHWRYQPAPPSDKPAPTPLDPDTAAANAVMIAGLPGLIEALEFYRDAFRFVPKRSATGIDLSTWKPKEDLLEDCGEKARAALASIGRTL